MATAGNPSGNPPKRRDVNARREKGRYIVPARDEDLPRWANDGDIDAVRRYIFSGVDIFGKTYLPRLETYQQLPADMKASVVTVCGMAEAYLAGRGGDTHTAMVGRMIAETLLPNPEYATAEEISNKLVAWASALWANKERQVEGLRLRLQDYAADRAEGGKYAGLGLPDPDSTAVTDANAWAVIMWVAERGITDEARKTPVLAYVYVYVALAKKGTITQDKLRKISQAVTAECGVPVSLDRMLLSRLFTLLSARLKDEDYAVVFKLWEQYMTGVSLRMRITLAQAAGEGLTSLTTIKNALVTFPTFPWDKVVGLLPRDADRVTQALVAVGDDQYYGFRKNYGPVAATGYRSFAWVAKELLIRYGGPEYTGLREFRGWTTTPLHKEELEKLIHEFTPPTTVEVAQGDVAELRRAALAATGLV